MAISSRHPVRIILRRLSQGLYFLAGLGFTGILVGPFFVELRGWVIATAAVTSALLAAFGLIAEILEESL